MYSDSMLVFSLTMLFRGLKVKVIPLNFRD